MRQWLADIRQALRIARTIRKRRETDPRLRPGAEITEIAFGLALRIQRELDAAAEKGFREEFTPEVVDVYFTPFGAFRINWHYRRHLWNKEGA